MGKKHSGIKTGSFKELADNEVPEHLRKALEKDDVKAISGRERDFVQMQKNYYLSCIGVNILGAELEAFIEQMRMKPEERTIKWNGMVMPPKVLASHILLKNQKYVEGIHEKEGMKKNLQNYGLTNEQISIVGSDGHYVTKMPKDVGIGEDVDNG